MKLYEFSASEYGDKIAKIWFNWKDVMNLATLVGIWPNRSGWGFGYVDLAQQVEGTEVTLYRADDEGNLVTKRHYGLMKVTWERGAKEREEQFEWLDRSHKELLALSKEWKGEMWRKVKEDVLLAGEGVGTPLGIIEVGDVSQKDIEELKQKLVGTWEGEETLMGFPIIWTQVEEEWEGKIVLGSPSISMENIGEEEKYDKTKDSM